MKHHIGAWLRKSTRLAVVLVAQHLIFTPARLLLPQKAWAQSTVGSSPTLPAVRRLGVNLGGWGNYGSSNFFQNILMNPGFEPSQSARVVSAASPTATTFCDS